MTRRVALPAQIVTGVHRGVVDVLTGDEPLVAPLPTGPLSVVDAQALTNRIRQAARDVGDRVARLLELVDQAIAGDAWTALGYDSVAAYLVDTLEPMRLPIEQRRQVTGWLSGRGLSTRAIAPILSVDQKTVSNDRRILASVPASAGEESSSPASAVIGLDGKTYSAAPRLQVVPALADDVAPEVEVADAMPARGRERAFIAELAEVLAAHGSITPADWRDALRSSAPPRARTR
ncbi:hypothetical protein [Cellulomonas sp. HZM]|uniref:hypothetical protein n=1 Tax=Cellulomonas sp. HZM TaxID=1454010 RepID=UPI000492F690|nr:hypothetical protein [Cellulomonas sp. HZM]